VAGASDHSHSPAAEGPGLEPEQGRELGPLLQLGAVTALERRPLCRVVAEPFAQLGAGRDLLQPQVHGEFVLLDAPWPDAVDQHPHSVLLLDEIEKAHPDLFNVLLQIMDYGKLTDHNGKSVDFRNVILIMTTNAGAADLAKPAIGFERSERGGEDEEAINRMFSPEFRNRLDAVIPFSNLTPEIVSRVVDKFVMQLEAQLADRNVTIELAPAARDWLAKKGYEPLYGARPLARVIQEHIKKPLAEELLFGKLAKGGTVQVEIKDDAPVFGFPDNKGGGGPKGKGGPGKPRRPRKPGKPKSKLPVLVE